VPIEAGQQLLHYRLIEKIGEGGMGVVWKAEDTKLHRYIALKVLPEAMAADPERRARFEREARAVAALNHPNIVTLHSVDEADTPAGSVHFITMELVDGRPLTQLVLKSGFPLSRLLEIAIPLADAVSRAHRAGITHRDLKPDNIMIDDEGRLRVLDFGLAKLREPAGTTRDTRAATVTSDTAEGRVLGTVAYMSPEQAEGKEVDARSDVFSLGTILYEMASGTRPFHGETIMSTIGAILKDEPSSITELKPSLPRHAGRIIRRCLAKDPDRRYQTALDLRNELEELKAEIDAGAHAAVPADGETRSRRFLVPILVGAILVLAAGAIVTVSLWNRDESRPTSFTHRPVTANAAWDSDASWSPDGKFIAIDRMNSGNSDVYIKPIDGGKAVARVEEPGDQGAPRWSPDGRHLAYVSNEPGSPVFLVPPDGGKSKRLIETNLPALSSSMNAIMGNRPWSSDGKTLLVSRSTDGKQFAVHRVDRDTGHSEPLTFPPAGRNDSHASYSFDNARILFRRGDDLGSYGRVILMVMPAGGGEPEVLLEEINIGRLAWRPDNRRIVFQKDRSLNEIDVVTRKRRQLSSGTKRLQGISVSPDDRLVYADFWHDQFLYVVDVETGQREQITSHARNNGGARFAPDGRTVAYASNRTGNEEIWLHHLDGRSETQLTDDDNRYVYPEWSPDAKRIVFQSDQEGGAPKLFVANTDGGGGVRLLVDQQIGGGMNVTAPGARHRWAPDGELIAYQVAGDEGPELWTVGPDGEGARKRIDGVTEFDWYRDSRRGLLARPRGSETELIAVDLESGRERILFVGALQEIDVAPDGSAVAFCFGRGHFSMGLAVLKLSPPSDPDGLPTAVGEPEYVVPTEGTWHVHNGGWSPDSREVVYTHDQDYGDIYELVENR
jgi:serine/threonine protein kinase